MADTQSRTSPSLPPGRGSPRPSRAHPPSQHPQGAPTSHVLSSASYGHQRQALGDLKTQPENHGGPSAWGRVRGKARGCPPPGPQLGPNVPLATALWACRHGTGCPGDPAASSGGAECCEAIRSGAALGDATADSWPRPCMPLSGPLPRTSSTPHWETREEGAGGGAGEQEPRPQFQQWQTTTGDFTNWVFNSIL